MQSNQPNPYLKMKIMTASPSELRLMLYDGAIKFCHQTTGHWTRRTTRRVTAR
jgi:flagellin-specific chaperone FliS